MLLSGVDVDVSVDVSLSVQACDARLFQNFTSCSELVLRGDMPVEELVRHMRRPQAHVAVGTRPRHSLSFEASVVGGDDDAVVDVT
jgi:hypothetical protein